MDGHLAPIPPPNSSPPSACPRFVCSRWPPSASMPWSATESPQRTPEIAIRMALGANGPRWRAVGGFQFMLDGDVLRVALAVVATPRWAAYCSRSTRSTR